MEADALSRNKRALEWTILPSVVQALFRLLGTLEIDLFCSEANHCCHQFLSINRQGPSSGSPGCSAAAREFALMYALPPLHLNLQVLAKLASANGKWGSPAHNPVVVRCNLGGGGEKVALSREGGIVAIPPI